MAHKLHTYNGVLGVLRARDDKLLEIAICVRDLWDFHYRT